MSAPSAGWRRIVAPVLVGERRAALHHAVGQREPADVVQQAGGVGELLLLLAHPDARAAMSREKRGDGGGVARGARVALVERAQQAARARPTTAPRTPRALARLPTTSRAM